MIVLHVETRGVELLMLTIIYIQYWFLRRARDIVFSVGNGSVTREHN